MSADFWLEISISSSSTLKQKSFAERVRPLLWLGKRRPRTALLVLGQVRSRVLNYLVSVITVIITRMTGTVTLSSD